MDPRIERQLEVAVEEAAIKIVADDLEVQKLVAWALGKEIELEPGEDPDYYALIASVNKRYGANRSVLDRAMAICEKKITIQELLKDSSLQQAAGRIAFTYGEPGQQAREEYIRLAQQRGLSEQEAMKLIAQFNSRPQPNTDDLTYG